MLVQQVNKIGEQIVYSWLKNHGFNTVYKIEGLDFLVAESTVRKILVHIKTSQAQALPFTQEDVASAIEAANKLYKEAWGATLKIDNNGNLAGEIIWFDFGKKST